jgi:hypothetical protein
MAIDADLCWRLQEAAPPAMQPGMKGVATRSAGGAHDFVKDAQLLVRN